MAESPIWIPNRSRAEVTFATADLRIRELASFVCEVAADLERGTSLARAARSAARRLPRAAEAFDLEQPDTVVEAQFGLKDSVTFPDEPLPASISFERHLNRITLKLDSILARDVRLLWALCGTGRCTADEIRRTVDERVGLLFESLLENDIVVAAARRSSSRLPTADRPGVTRLQHAGLLYRGRDAGVLVDPHFHSSYEPDGLGDTFLRCQFEGLVDAILISHGHHDHWHLPTLMSFPADTLIVVPKVPRATMLCPDFATTLRALGFTRVVPLGWSDPPLRIGDLEVHAFPFYGEQPLVGEAPRHPDLRNYGNTYVVRHDSYTSWFLVDSGNDSLGRMADAAYEVQARFGHIDLLMSNLREFAVYHPLAITGGHYWLALAPDQLRRFTSFANHVITLGANGVAEICRIVRARRFLPYAHWWQDIGGRPPDEDTCIERLRASLTELGARTPVFPWRIGESYLSTMA